MIGYQYMICIVMWLAILVRHGIRMWHPHLTCYRWHVTCYNSNDCINLSVLDNYHHLIRPTKNYHHLIADLSFAPFLRMHSLKEAWATSYSIKKTMCSSVFLNLFGGAFCPRACYSAKWVQVTKLSLCFMIFTLKKKRSHMPAWFIRYSGCDWN